MPAFVSADPDIAKAGAVHNAALDAVQSAMASLSDVAIVSRPVDKDGNPLDGPAPEAAEAREVLIEQALEEAHRRRVVSGTARSSIDLITKDDPQPAKPSLVVTLQAELDGLGMRLGELRAQYLLNERALMAQIEQVATRLALAKEMVK